MGYETGQEETLSWVATLLGWPDDAEPTRDAIEEAIHVLREPVDPNALGHLRAVLRNERLSWKEAVQQVDRLRSTRDARVAELEGEIAELRAKWEEEQRIDARRCAEIDGLRSEIAGLRAELRAEAIDALNAATPVPGRKSSAERESHEQQRIGDESRAPAQAELAYEIDPGAKRAASPAPKASKVKPSPKESTAEPGADPLRTAAESLGKDHARTRPKRRSDQAGLLELLSSGKPEDTEIVKRGGELFLAYKRSFTEAAKSKAVKS